MVFLLTTLNSLLPSLPGAMVMTSKCERSGYEWHSGCQWTLDKIREPASCHLTRKKCPMNIQHTRVKVCLCIALLLSCGDQCHNCFLQKMELTGHFRAIFSQTEE